MKPCRETPTKEGNKPSLILLRSPSSTPHELVFDCPGSTVRLPRLSSPNPN
jgi:hypothetical protein